MITTTEAARIAEVTPSTIKRWADQGLLPVLRTAGGHRRFDRSDVERLVRQQAQDDSATDPLIEDWLDLLMHARRHEVESTLLSARTRLGSWYRVADELGEVFSEMGHRWADGALSIAEEHIASNAVTRSIAKIGDSLPGRIDGPVALLACPGDEEHTLALSLVELCFREMGWRPLWLGRRTPLDELLALVADGEITIVALSASESFTDAGALKQVVDELGAACRERNTHLLLGGKGPWPEDTGPAVRFSDFASLHEWLRHA